MTDLFGTTAPAEDRAFRATRLHAIYRLSGAPQHAATLHDIFELAVDGVISATGAQRAAILLFDAGRIMRFRASRGLSEGYRGAAEGHNPWHPQDRDPLPILIEDVHRDASLAAVTEALGAALDDGGVRARFAAASARIPTAAERGPVFAANLVRTENVRWGQFIREAGIERE